MIPDTVMGGRGDAEKRSVFAASCLLFPAASFMKRMSEEKGLK